MLRCYPAFLDPLIRFANHHQLRLPAWLNDADAIDVQHLTCLWRSLSEQYEDVELGYRAGGFLQPACWPGLTEHLVRCDSFRTAYRLVLAGQMQMASVAFLELDEGEDRVALTVRWPGLPEDVWLQMEEYTVRCLVMLACWLRKPHQWIRRIELSRQDSDSLRPDRFLFLRYVLGREGQFHLGCSRTAILIDRAVYDAPLKSGPGLTPVQPRADVERRGGPETLADRVRQLIDARLEDPGLSRKYTASALHMSERTLQRGLCATGTSYGDILNEARLERARERLLHSKDCTLAIANAVGFSDPANFFRFFKRMEGVTPNQYRQNGRAIHGLEVKG